jgi:adenylate cyclase
MPEDRRLAAIMFTDIVGYTALMGRDEDQAFKILSINREIHKTVLERHNGILIKEMGDGILASFSSNSDAVRCAIEIQQEAKSENIKLRIGIHEGEMVFVGTDVLGDGVNIASRLEELAEEGCINISGAVYKDIKNKAGIKAEFVDEKVLKNVEGPVKIYRIKCTEPEQEVFDKKPFMKSTSKLLFYIIGVLIIIALGFLIWQFLPSKKITPVTEELENVQIDKSIAVLPFTDMSPEKNQEYFSDGMMDEILMHLYKIGELEVVSRTSAMRYKETDKLISEIASELGVTHILEGSVRKDEDRVRITVQLIDAVNDKHLWAESYDEELNDVFAIQSDVAQKVAMELKATLTPRENEFIQRKPATTNSLAYDFYLQGNDYWARVDARLALEMYTKAISEDSIFASAYARRAFMHLHFCWLKIEGWPGHDTLAMEDIRKAYQLDPESIDAKLAEATYYYMIDRDYDRSIEILSELKEYAPNMAELYAYVSYNLRRQGKWEESISELKQGILLDPFNANYIRNLLQSYGILHQYDTLINYARHGLSLIPDFEGFKIQIFWATLNNTGDLKTALNESGLKDEEVQQYQVYYYNRQFDELIEFINKELKDISDQGVFHPKIYELAYIYHLNGLTTQSKIYADSAITFLREQLKEFPDDSRLYSTLGKCYALKGNAEEAFNNGRKAIGLLPISLDALQGPVREQDLLEIYIITRNYDLAMDKIEYLLSIPSGLSIGELKINPLYDVLRDLPRFQEIIDEARNEIM